MQPLKNVHEAAQVLPHQPRRVEAEDGCGGGGGRDDVAGGVDAAGEASEVRGGRKREGGDLRGWGWGVAGVGRGGGVVGVIVALHD